MTYSTGNIITAADYNSFVSTVNGAIGTGSGSKGYGQSALSTVSATDQITAAQWTALLNAVRESRPIASDNRIRVMVQLPQILISINILISNVFQKRKML